MKLRALLRERPTEVLAGSIPEVSVRRISDRPIFHLKHLIDGEEVAVKMSRLTETALAAQLSLTSQLQRHCRFVPKNLGHCRIGEVLFEVWEWLEASDAMDARVRLQSMDRVLRAFVAAAKHVDIDNAFQISKDTLIAFHNMLEGDAVELPLSTKSEDVAALEILAIAKEFHAQQNFRSKFSQLPRAFIHTDIRAENFFGGYLIDYSNSTIGARIMELVRFLLINFDQPILTLEYASNPWLAFGDSSLALSPLEHELLRPILYVDFANIYWWALRQVSISGYRSEWAKKFLGEGPAHFMSIIART